MYSAVGFGGMTAQKIIARILDEYRKDHEEEQQAVEEKLKELNTPKPKKQISTNGIIVEGIDNCLVKTSTCCNPLPGDEIIGYITRGTGVSIHRKDCKNLKDLFQDEESRMINVRWAEDEKTAYCVDVEINSNDRDNLLLDIIKALQAEKSKTNECSIKS